MSPVDVRQDLVQREFRNLVRRAGTQPNNIFRYVFLEEFDENVVESVVC